MSKSQVRWFSSTEGSMTRSLVPGGALRLSRKPRKGGRPAQPSSKNTGRGLEFLKRLCADSESERERKARDWVPEQKRGLSWDLELGPVGVSVFLHLVCGGLSAFPPAERLTLRRPLRGHQMAPPPHPGPCSLSCSLSCPPGPAQSPACTGSTRAHSC